ncbi:MAG: hypothetical protein EXS64_06060 [Candidatus Latescibacteria bacterium]|nr:hypothetical protein [Candidatus Latescibacterota bacterium]
MQTVIVGQDGAEGVRRSLGEVGKGWDQGRFWTVETYFLYILLWDPFILCRTQGAPALHASGADVDRAAQTMLFFAQSGTVADRPLIAQVLKRGGCVVLQQPAAELLEEVGGPMTLADVRRPTLVSLRERWDLGSGAARPYYYPHMQPFLRLAPNGAQVLTRIGGNPDLVVSHRAAVWAGNAFQAAVRYTNLPDVLSHLLAELAGLMAQVVGGFVDDPLRDEEQQRLTETFELRRDFHALGYAYLTVQELARCLGREAAGLADVAGLAVAAAGDLVAGDDEAAERGLKHTFQALERVNRTLQPTPAVFTDTLHGGELYPDIGYFEIDWPQHPADVLETYMHLVRTRSYRFNVDFGATTVRELALRFPDLFAELRLAQDQRLVEFVNGSCNQPYPPLHSLESQIRQFDVGVQVWQEVFGRPPGTYASQEYGFCPQIGAVLAQQGYDQAVIRVQNMGDAPTLRDEQIDWVAPSGDRLRSLPSHPHKSEQLNMFTYNNLHLKLFLHQRETPDFAVFTCLGDITYYRHLREELARVCHYAPVFGRFATFAEYFDVTRHRPAPERRPAMRDFHCDAGFLNLDLWGIYQENTGNYNTHCVRSLGSTSQFAAAELIDGVAIHGGAQPMPDVDHDAHWEALTHYQGHGTYIVPWYPSGAFLGGIGNPRTAKVGYGVPNICDYVGPFSPRLMKEVTEPMMDASERQAAYLMQQRLQAMAPASIRGTGFMLYSFAPGRRRVVTLADAAGRAICAGDQALAAQDFGRDRLALVDLPSYGYAVVDARAEAGVQTAVIDPVSVGADHLENRALRVEFDPATGMLRRLLCKATGHELLGPGSGAFTCPEGGGQRCRGIRPVASGPLRGAFEFDIELPVKDQKPCRLRTRAWLDAEASVVEFETEVDDVPELKGNQWRNHLGVRFALAGAGTPIQTCHFNVLEPHDGEQLFSPNVLVAQGEPVSTVFLNEGNEFYLRQGAALSNILIFENEVSRRFRYAVGIAGNNPLMQGRIWHQPVIPTPISAGGSGSPVREPSGSFLSFDSPDVELLSCRLKGDVFRVRLANTTGKAVQTHLRMFLPIASAELTGLDGRRAVEQPVAAGQVALSLRPWDIRQLHLRLG